MTTAEAERINKNYGAGLAALRRLAGIRSQQSLGELVDMHQATVSEIERGVRSLRSDEIEMFISFFADKIPGFSEDDCLRVLRSGGQFRLRLVAGDDVSSAASDTAKGGYPTPESDLTDLSAVA